MQHKLHKRTQVKAEGTLIVKDRQQLTTLKEFRARSNRKKAKKQERANRAKLT